MIAPRTAILLSLGLVVIAWFTLFCSNPMFRARVAVVDDVSDQLAFGGTVRAFDAQDSLDAVLEKASVNILARLQSAFPDPTPEEEMRAALDQAAPPMSTRFTRALSEMDPTLAGGIVAARSAVIAAVPNLPSASI